MKPVIPNFKDEWADSLLVVILLAACLLFSPGCSSFRTVQTDERINAKTGEKTKISTKATSRTFFDSKSALTSFKAAQTEKSQGASVGSLNQESAGTNAVNTLNALKGVLEAVPK